MSKLQQLRPSGLHHNPAYSHVVVASGARTIYIAGQVSTDEEGRVVGEGDLAAQTTQVMHNIGLALKAAGASYSNIVKITTFVVGYKPELRPIIGSRLRPWPSSIDVSACSCRRERAVYSSSSSSFAGPLYAMPLITAALPNFFRKSSIARSA
jgi:enamine deaminase RidA (YjgF/YER057c/UK114 family)